MNKKLVFLLLVFGLLPLIAATDKITIAGPTFQQTVGPHAALAGVKITMNKSVFLNAVAPLYQTSGGEGINELWICANQYCNTTVHYHATKANLAHFFNLTGVSLNKSQPYWLLTNSSSSIKRAVVNPYSFPAFFKYFNVTLDLFEGNTRTDEVDDTGAVYMTATTAPSLNINNPTGILSSKTVNYNVSLSSPGDGNYSTCLYYVLKSSTVEVANTTINCSSPYATGNFTVGADATYTFWLFVNNSYSDTTKISNSFIVSTSGGGSPGGGGSSGGGGGSVAPPAATLTKTVNICDANLLPFSVAFDAWKKDFTNIEKFKAAWYAYWDYSKCYQAASIVPLDLLVNQTPTQ